MVSALVLGLVGSALAGGKGGGTRGSLTLVVLSSETAAASTDSADTSVVTHYGDEITFEVSTTATDEPFVNVRCYHGDAFVCDGWAGFFAWAWGGQTFTLTSLAEMAGWRGRLHRQARHVGEER